MKSKEISKNEKKSRPESRHKKLKCKYKGCNRKIRARLIEGHYRKHNMQYLRDIKGKFTSKNSADIVTKNINSTDIVTKISKIEKLADIVTTKKSDIVTTLPNIQNNIRNCHQSDRNCHQT